MLSHVLIVCGSLSLSLSLPDGRRTKAEGIVGAIITV